LHLTIYLQVEHYTLLAYSVYVFTFIESSVFSKYRDEFLDDEAYRKLQQHLLQQPEAGSVIKGTGGVRKLRWRLPKTGKSGGVRIIYYVQYSPNEFWLLTIYAKAKQDAIPAHIAKKLKEVF
jgi:mRNA-degrading endonuclease RelE of RelBE toxin-antitoxin system